MPTTPAVTNGVTAGSSSQLGDDRAHDPMGVYFAACVSVAASVRPRPFDEFPVHEDDGLAGDKIPSRRGEFGAGVDVDRRCHPATIRAESSARFPDAMLG